MNTVSTVPSMEAAKQDTTKRLFIRFSTLKILFGITREIPLNGTWVDSMLGPSDYTH